MTDLPVPGRLRPVTPGAKVVLGSDVELPQVDARTTAGASTARIQIIEDYDQLVRGGLTGDGSDETAKFQAVIDAASSHAGGTVLVQPSLVPRVANLVMRNGVNLKGISCGYGSGSAIRLHHAGAPLLRYGPADTSHTVVSGLELHGTGLGLIDTGTIGALLEANVNAVWNAFRDVTFRQFETCVRVGADGDTHNYHGATFSNCNWLECRDGLILSSANASGWSVRDCAMTGHRYGIWAKTASFGSIDNFAGYQVDGAGSAHIRLDSFNVLSISHCQHEGVAGEFGYFILYSQETSGTMPRLSLRGCHTTLESRFEKSLHLVIDNCHVQTSEYPAHFTFAVSASDARIHVLGTEIPASQFTLFGNSAIVTNGGVRRQQTLANPEGLPLVRGAVLGSSPTEITGSVSLGPFIGWYSARLMAQIAAGVTTTLEIHVRHLDRDGNLQDRVVVNQTYTAGATSLEVDLGAHAFYGGNSVSSVYGSSSVASGVRVTAIIDRLDMITTVAL